MREMWGSGSRNSWGPLGAALLAAVVALMLVLASEARGQDGPPKTELGPVEEEVAPVQAAPARTKDVGPDAASAGDPEPPELRVDEDPEGIPYVAGELLVAYERGATRGSADAANREVGAKTLGVLPEVDSQVVSFPDVKAEGRREVREQELERRRQQLERRPEVAAADYNYVVEPTATPNDPFYGFQWGVPRVGLPQAWDITRGDGSVIAVLDTGIDATHPELASKIEFQDDFIDGVGGDTTAEDVDGHGTHVAGTAAAHTNNAVGVAGAAPGAKLQIAKVLGPGRSSFDNVARAIDWAMVAPAADVINMSLGGCGDSEVLERSVNNAWNNGTVVVAAAGNSAERDCAGNVAAPPNNNPVVIPAKYANVIAVGAVNFQNAKSNFSSYGYYVDIAAPGGSTVAGTPATEEILSTWPLNVPNNTDVAGYHFTQGTSMASPMVAGIAALLAGQGLNNAQIRQRLESTATDLGPAGRDDLYGYGLVNAQAATSTPAPPPPPPPANTPPRITAWAPKASTADNTPTIRGTVIDDQHYLYRGNIRLYVDGRRVTNFAVRVNRSTTLTHTTKYLRNGRHSARIVVTDPNGASAARTWRFTVR